MSEARFQPRGFLKFNLQQGQLSTRDKRRYLVVPAELITAASESDELAEAARKWGMEQGESLADLIGDSILDEAPEEFVTELTHLLASLGWGLCDFESWGSVLCVVAQNAPRGGATTILNHFLAGIFTSIVGERFDCIPVQRNGNVLFVLTGPEGASEVRAWVEQGAEIGEIARRMHAGEHLPAGFGSR
jgi:hypothetical protein